MTYRVEIRDGNCIMFIEPEVDETVFVARKDEKSTWGVQGSLNLSPRPGHSTIRFQTKAYSRMLYHAAELADGLNR